MFIGKIDAEVDVPILWPPNKTSQLMGKDWCWERLKAEVEGGNRGRDGWMTSPTQWM